MIISLTSLLLEPVQPQTYQELIKEFKLNSLATPCTGAFAYYSGTNFTWDAMRMKNVYLGAYSAANKTLVDPLYPPAAMVYNLSGYDCRSFAHAIYCLSEYYAQTTQCEPYITGNHIGQHCWEKIGRKMYESVI